jgi:hypothetical protein
MPWLCRVCNAESDGAECEYCDGPAVEVPEIWELRVEIKCPCGSRLTTRIDHDHPDILDMNHSIFRYCPACHEWRVHTRSLKRIKPKVSHDEFLVKATKQELKIGEQR